MAPPGVPLLNPQADFPRIQPAGHCWSQTISAGDLGLFLQALEFSPESSLVQRRTCISGATVDSGFHVDAIQGQTSLGNSYKGARAISFHGSCIARPVSFSEWPPGSWGITLDY